MLLAFVDFLIYIFESISTSASSWGCTWYYALSTAPTPKVAVPIHMHPRRAICRNSPHSIFEISPNDELWLLAQREFGSDLAMGYGYLSERTRNSPTEADAVASFYRYISGTSDAGSLQSHVFERQ
jgi:hypothetical protein